MTNNKILKTRHIQNLVKHYFRKKAPSQIFDWLDWFVNTPIQQRSLPIIMVIINLKLLLPALICMHYTISYQWSLS